jgi:phosphate-selective porin OprO and OprP
MSKKHAFSTAAFAALAAAAGAAATTTNAQAQTAVSPPPPPVTVTTRWNGSPETREEDRRFHVNGRFQYDVASTDADCANAACTGVNESGIRSYARRAFLGVDGRLTERWRYNVKFDFNLSGSPSVRADDLYLEYAAPNYSFIVGNNNAVSVMEDRDSSLNIPFNERSFLVSATGWGKRPGIAFITNGGNWSFGTALASNDTLDTTDTAANGTEAYFVAARGTFAPLYAQNTDGTIDLLHFGLSARYRDNGDGAANTLDGAFSYSPNALSNKSNNNAGVGGAESDFYVGAEAAFQWHSFGAEAEFGQVSTSDTTIGPNAAAQAGDADFNSYYIDLFWSPTGESRKYNAADGSFGAVTPNRTLGSDGGIGHIMLSARYENIDLSDTNFGANRNETTAYTVGATWVPIAHVKFQLNYSSTDIDYSVNNAGHVDNTINAATLRTQFDW